MSIFLRRRGRLQYSTCAFTNDPVHTEHVRDAYEAALPFLKAWCHSLHMDYHWHEKRFSLHERSAACLQSSEGSTWSRLQIILPHHADVFFSEEFQEQFAAMFGECDVRYDTEDLATPRIANAPQPLIDIISLLQCVLPGQLSFMAYRDDGALSHVNFYPSSDWCMHHMDEVMAVTVKWLDLNAGDSIDLRITSYVVGVYFQNRHTMLPVHGDCQGIDIEQFRWTAKLVSDIRDRLTQPETPQTPLPRALGEDDLYGDPEPDSPTTPVLCSTSSSPLDKDAGASLPSSPSERYYQSDDDDEDNHSEFSVDLPDSSCCDYVGPGGIQVYQYDTTVAEGDMDDTLAPSNNIADPSSTPASVSAEVQSPRPEFEPSVHWKDMHTFKESKRYLSAVEKSLLTSEAWDARLDPNTRVLTQSRSSFGKWVSKKAAHDRKQRKGGEWKSKGKGKATPAHWSGPGKPRPKQEVGDMSGSSVPLIDRIMVRDRLPF
ncbi:hypothetical protein CALVIDRAFT_280350 [Calocera viscosa TUFC12733]|uniref:Uncharacterized protein n=1 Tax=Calocera viscosa (strain TUFC12733) TaxID=1330018 RepID=A0A167R5L1_CALVF|nr:hypothetical protein CALVIDRAFT_280350 [Calocera viscosa TUFC12733]